MAGASAFNQRASTRLAPQESRMSRHNGFCRGKIPLFFLCIFLGPVCQAQESCPDSAISKSPAADAKRPNLVDLSLEELMAVEIKVSTVSRQSESLSQARLPFL